MSTARKADQYHKFFYLLAFGLFLSLPAQFFCLAEDDHLIINELQITGGTGKTENDFVEIYNPTNASVNLKGYRLVKRTKTGTSDTSIKSWTSDTIVASKDYYLWANSKDGFADTIKADSATSQSISNDNGIAIRKGADDTGEIIDSVGWGNCQNIFVEKTAFPDNPPANKSIGRKDFKDSDDNAADFSLKDSPSPTGSKPADPTPNPLTPPAPPDVKDYSGKLKINEIFPAPKSKNAGKEYVEIFNLSDETINLSGMRIEDEKNHKVMFPAENIKPKDFFVLEGNFELNNTSPDTAFLIAKDGTKEKPIDFTSYTDPTYDYTYAWNGSAWQWTSKETKGTKNQFDEVLSGQIKRDKIVYAGVYANFKVKTDDKAQHFTWNFGDGHKSYLKKTRHKYEKSGDYAASLKITGEGEAALLNFIVKAEKFGKTKLKITSLSANPKGRDSENEWLELSNNTKKKIDLKGWSVATGWKNLYNHPITESFVMKAGETKKLTRKDCAFTLGNKQAKIELRYPNGKVADKIKYDRRNDSISEDELYQKDGSDWQWIGAQEDTQAQVNPDVSASETPSLENDPPKSEDSSSQIAQDNNEVVAENAEADLLAAGKLSENPFWNSRRIKQSQLLFVGSNIIPSGRVFGKEFFSIAVTQKDLNQRQDETVLVSSDTFWRKINSKLNTLIHQL